MRMWLAGILIAIPAAQLQQPALRREVAITIDDVPNVHTPGGRCNYEASEQLNRKLLGRLNAHKIPAIGLVVERNVCADDGQALTRLLNMWLDAGMELGNHSYSHFDLNNTPLERYQADVIRGEATTRRLLEQRGRKLRYFRHPFLHAGKDLATKRKFEQFLAERGYQIAPVTIDNQEYVFALAYARALQRADRAALQRIGVAYISYMEDVVAFFERWSVEVVGREIRQVLLLHANPLNADYMDQLVAMLKGRGYTFITLERALQDPAYRLPDRYAGPRGLSWLHRWALSKGRPIKEEPREPDWIKTLSQAR